MRKNYGVEARAKKVVLLENPTVGIFQFQTFTPIFFHFSFYFPRL